MATRDLEFLFAGVAGTPAGEGLDRVVITDGASAFYLTWVVHLVACCHAAFDVVFVFGSWHGQCGAWDARGKDAGKRTRSTDKSKLLLLLI